MFCCFWVFILLMLFFSFLNLCIDVFHYFLQNFHYFLFQYYFHPFLSLSLPRTHLLDWLKFPHSFGYSDFPVMIFIYLFLSLFFFSLYVSVFSYFYRSTSNSTNSFLSCGKFTGELNEEIFHYLYSIVSFSSKFYLALFFFHSF